VAPPSAVGSAGAQRARLATLIALALLVLTVVTARTIALLQDSQGVGGNTFSTAGCFQPRVNTRQTGTAASNANGTLTVPIASVDPTRSFLLFSTRHNSNRPVGSTLRGRIATATSLEFARVTDEAAPTVINIRWYVVEYQCGISVQRGQTTQSATTVDIPIGALGAVNRAFVTWSKTAQNTDTTWDNDDPVVMRLTSTTNLRLQANAANANHIIWWQVVEFTFPGAISVQQGNTSLTGATISTNVALGSAVNLARTFVLVDYLGSGTGPDIGARMVRARLTGPATLVIDRSVAGTPDDLTQIHWQVVELLDGSVVQGGSVNLPGGTATLNVPIPPVDLARVTAFAAVQSGGGQNAGISPYVADDILGVGSVTISLAAAQATIQRNNSAAAADIGGFIVEWGPP
jgi:hypothetical protein